MGSSSDPRIGGVGFRFDLGLRASYVPGLFHRVSALGFRASCVQGYPKP